MKVAILGGGIGGLCAAIALQQAGLEATVYEAAPELKPLGAGLTLAANAMQGLVRLGLKQQVVGLSKEMQEFTILDEKGRTISRQNSEALNQKYGISNFAIHRAALHQILQENLQPGTLHLNKRCATVNQNNAKITLAFTDETKIEADLLVAADGIHSVVRQQFWPQSSPRFAGYTCWRAVIDNPVPAPINTQATETWGRKGRVGLVPLQENKIYWFACINASVGNPEMKQMTPEKLAGHFAGYHGPVTKIISATRSEQLLWNDIYDIKPLPTLMHNRVVLLGDAGHATTPNLGQGACQAIEDAVVLGQCLKGERDLKVALKEYEQRRLVRTSGIITTSRRIGEIAHWQNPFLIKLRNALFRSMPASINKKQLEMLYKVDF